MTGWGKARNKYDQDEARLIVRMLPLETPSQKSVSKGKARADNHLWPKGTLLSICGEAKKIDQRKQEAHKPESWVGISCFFDATAGVTPDSRVRPEISLDLCCFEDKPFAICIAICKFQKPHTLYHLLMNKAISELSMKDSLDVARKWVKRNYVVLDDSDGDDQSGSFTFKLTCSLSHSLIRTPVRGISCRHFQCFDFQNFLEMNQNATGTRWECPVCSQTTSVYDLQHCALTKHILNQYKDQASAQRDRVEFFSDGQWKLLAEETNMPKGTKKRIRYNPSASTEARAAKKEKPFEIIDID